MTEQKEPEKKVDVSKMENPKELDGVPDLSMLVYLEMHHVLHNLHYRFCKMPSKNVYTSISTILVAINPYERLPMYGEDVINEFHEACKKGRLPSGRPHPYGVSARSYMRMIQRKCNQSVIVCGESGAGKTETTKLLMRYLAMTAPSTNMESSIIEQQIIAASPILEAYGNAKTVLNNNSSRFGKFTKLLYDVPDKAKEGHILGSYMETYLLEKSRVVFQAENERNYHIPYFLHAGIAKDKHPQFKLTKPEDFIYSNQGNCCEIAGVSDKDRFDELAESLRLMRIDDTLQQDLWKLTSGILNMGNVKFKREGDGFASVEKGSMPFVENVAEMWGIDANALVERLTTSTMKVMKKSIVKKILFDDAQTNRDSIAKGIYENIFLWLCARINAELYQMDEDPDDENDKPSTITNILFIGILDVFGFENFYINSLEQFCINFTNEKLQQFFNYHIIRSEQEEYIKESVFWKPLSIPDNLECINMIEEEKMGFFVILDGACKAPQPTVEAFMQELFKQHGKNTTIRQAKQPGSGNARGGPKTKAKKGGPKDRFDGFMINHFADDVTYDASNFLMKNMEAVHPDTAKMMQESKTELVKQVAVDQGASKKKAKLSVTGTFNRGIKTLMKNLKATEPFFVRCVNPNMQKSATIWSEEVVEHQLRCGGLVEALKVLKLGYPTRVPYSTLYEKYHSSVTNPLIKNMGPESFSTALLIAFDVSEEDYELGLTKIFFKPSKAAVLDTIMSQAGQPLSPEQNIKITKWVVQKRIKQMIGTCKAFLELRKRVRLARAAQRWQYAGRVVAILGGSVCRHLILARDAILKRKREQGAIAMQSFFRGSYECARYRSHIIKVRKATKMIWISYRRWNERVLLKKWLEVKVAETRERKKEEQRRLMEDEEKRKAEEKRLALEKARLEEEERLRDEQRKRQEAARLKAEEEERKLKEEQLRREKEEAMKRQAQASLKLTETKKEEEVKKKKEEREKRDESIKLVKKKRKNEEEDRRNKVEKEYRKKNFPEREDNESNSDQGSDKPEDDEEEESENEEPVKPVASLKERLKTFDKTAQTGQLFLKYTGKGRRKPQDRIVKVSFDDQGKPKQISWGSGSRHIDFSEILYVAHGHYTPVFLSRKDQLDPQLCFSVVGKTQILDVQAQTKDMAELWVKGLRKLIGQTDDKAEQLAKEAMDKGNLPGSGAPKEKTAVPEKQLENRTTSLMLLQQDLFVMTTTTVFRNLEEERIWEIDQSVRDKFNAKSLYEQALQNDIPWRQWNQWIRERIVQYLKENNKMIQTQNNFSAYGQPYVTPQIQQPYMTPQMVQQQFPVQRVQNVQLQQPMPMNVYPQYTPNIQQQQQQQQSYTNMQTQYNPPMQTQYNQPMQTQYNPNLQQNSNGQQNPQGDNCSMM